MQITNSTNSYLTNEVSNTKPISTTSVATKQDTAAETVSKSFDTFEYSTPQVNIGTTYSAKTLVATTNSVNTTSSSSTELSIYGLIARRAGVPTTSGGEPYINNATDAQKYSAALKSYNESLNKAAYFADLDVDSNGNAIFSSNADKDAYAQALYEYTKALGVLDKIQDNFPYTQDTYKANSDIKYPKAACAAFSYAAALSYLTDSTVDPKELNLTNNDVKKYTALSDWNYTDSATNKIYSVERHYDGNSSDKDAVFASIDQELGKGNVPILFHVDNPAKGEHWALITGKDENGEYQVFDPYTGDAGTLDIMQFYSDTGCTYSFNVITVN